MGLWEWLTDDKRQYVIVSHDGGHYLYLSDNNGVVKTGNLSLATRFNLKNAKRIRGELGYYNYMYVEVD